MADAPGEQLVEVDLFDWTGGIKNKRVNPLVTAQNAFVDGRDLDLVDGCLRTQRSDEELASGVSAGEVAMLEQVRFPTMSASYLLALVYNPGTPEA